jgi:hypothetical protein
MVETQHIDHTFGCLSERNETYSIDAINSLSEFKGLIFVRYYDHVLYNRTSALAMKPQVRETVGWLVYECEYYITITWDRDADPPTLKGGDPKASGLVLLKSDILLMKKLPLQEISEWLLNSGRLIVSGEYAFRPSERKTQRAKSSKGEN